MYKNSNSQKEKNRRKKSRSDEILNESNLIYLMEALSLSTKSRQNIYRYAIKN